MAKYYIHILHIVTKRGSLRFTDFTGIYLLVLYKVNLYTGRRGVFNGHGSGRAMDVRGWANNITADEIVKRMQFLAIFALFFKRHAIFLTVTTIIMMI